MNLTKLFMRLGLVGEIVSLLSFSAIAEDVNLKRSQVPRPVLAAFQSLKN